MHEATSLLEDARNGDKKALHDLILRYRLDIQRMALSQCANKVDAEDAAQESLLVIYRKIGTLRALKAFPGWMFTIIRHECHRLMRIRHRWVSVDDASVMEEGSTSDAPHRHFDIVSAITALSETDQRLIIYCYIEQRRISESASLVGISTTAAKSRLQRVRRLLRHRLRAYSYQTIEADTP